MTAGDDRQGERLLVALWPDPGLQQQLAALARSAAPITGGRPMRASSLHLTLAFVGDTPTTRLPALLDLLAALPCPVLSLQIDRLQRWPGNRIVWASLADGSALQRLNDWRRTLAQALQKDGFQVAEPDLWTPHLTLLRDTVAPPLAAPPETLDWQPSGYLLVASRRCGAARRYLAMARRMPGAPLEILPPDSWLEPDAIS